MKLHIGSGLSLPVEAVTQTIAILAKRRAGKSYTMRRLAEQLIHAHQQVVLVDPKGDQWGIRYAADGKGPGLSVVILGGERGDVPLEASAGEVVAKLVVEERVNLLLDLSHFRKHQVATFMTGFLENLYRLKAREIYRTPMMLVIDEADAVAPQKPQKGEERMLGAAEDIVRRGGQRGIGCTLVSQRSAVLNKNVLTQAQMLVALRTIAPQDLAAMDDWIKVHGEPGQRETLMESLPALPVGEAWFWSPGWPTAEGIFKRVHVQPIETFDSGATPKPGERRTEPKAAADVDLEALKRQMAQTIERAKADNPKLLRAQIARLEAELAKKPTTISAPRAPGKTTIADAEKRGYLRARKQFVQQMVKAADAVKDAYDAAERSLKKAYDAQARMRETAREALATEPPEPTTFTIRTEMPKPEAFMRALRSLPPQPPKRDQNGEALPPGEAATLTAAAQHHPVGVDRDQLSVLTGYKRSTRDAYIARLREKGFVELTAGGNIVATEHGRNALGPDFEPLPTGPDLFNYWRAKLPEGELKTLEAVAAKFPDPVAREAIDEATGFKRSTRDAYLSRLRARRLVDFAGRGEVRMSDNLA